MSSLALTQVNSTKYRDFFEGVPANNIFLLDEKLASDFWLKHISIEGNSYFSLPDNNWVINGFSEPLGDWLEAYNDDNNEPVSQLLKRSFSWSHNTSIWFCISKEIIFQLSWEDFLKHWDCFVAIDDDCPIVIGFTADLQQALILRGIGNMSKISHVKG